MHRNSPGDGFIKEVKLLDRVQAVIHIYIIHILSTIQEYCMKSELAGNKTYIHIYLGIVHNYWIKNEREEI